VLTMPLLSQGGGDVFSAIVPPLRSSFGFMKKKIAECAIPRYDSLLLFSFFSDSYSYRRVSLPSCRPSPSLDPPLTSC